jgi:hypothetical protein
MSTGASTGELNGTVAETSNPVDVRLRAATRAISRFEWVIGLSNVGGTIYLVCMWIIDGSVEGGPNDGDTDAGACPSVCEPGTEDAILLGSLSEYICPLGGSELPAGGRMERGTYLRSPNAQFLLAHQPDGNVVLYTTPLSPVWNTATYDQCTSALVMDLTGNLGLFDGDVPIWQSATRSAGASLQVRDAGDVVIQATNGVVVWRIP